MKAANVDDWVDLQKKTWKPIAEALVRGGKRAGWSLNVQVLPGDSDLKFNGVTVDVYPDWTEVFKEDKEVFKNVHPDRDFGATFEQFEKLRTLVSIQLFQVVDVVTPINSAS